jgi:hypothetical protein
LPKGREWGFIWWGGQPSAGEFTLFPGLVEELSKIGSMI